MSTLTEFCIQYKTLDILPHLERIISWVGSTPSVSDFLPLIFGVDMSLEDSLDSLHRDVIGLIQQKKRKNLAVLYIHGVRAKLSQSNFCLHQLSSLHDLTEETTTSTEYPDFAINDKVHFYCDSFWTFLYSSLDVLAQVLNQALKLDLDERDVGFKRIIRKLSQRPNLSPVHNSVVKCIKSHSFKNLENYRNCSTHRRQIYIEESTTTLRCTTGYKNSTGTPMTVINRLLCDNPLDYTPSVRQGRRIPQYMEKTRDSIKSHMSSILVASIPAIG